MSDAPHILVVDDDREIRTLLSDYLQKNGYRVTAVAEGKAMRRALDQTHVDLIVLDLMLPGEDGLKLCRDLRTQSQIPVLMLTALGEEIDRVLGLEVGADDYLPKPFSPRELVGRIKAILRRTVHMPRDPDLRQASGYKFGDWQLDNTTRTLTHSDGAQTALRGAELDPFDRSIDVRISRLRQTLRDDARAPRIIKTIYGEGYVIGVPVEE